MQNNHLKRRIRGLIVIFTLIYGNVSYSQNGLLKGRVTNEENNKPFLGATVSLLSQVDSSLVRLDITDADGRFSMPGLVSGNYILTISNVGYQQYVSLFHIDNGEKDLSLIKLLKQDKNLEGVTLVAKLPSVSQVGDTTNFNASAFKVNPDATAEDLIKKMPGISVDRSGTVTAMGDQVKNVTVDGKKFFGDDATAALRNLPADIIDKIQVFDKLSEQSQFTGFDDGTGAKGMNIVTKTGNRNGQFGRVYAGYGTDDRYNAGGNVSFFKGERRLSLVGLFNNINQQNFSTEDLLGVTSSGGGRTGGGGNRGGGRMGGGNSNFLVGQQNGISATQSGGANYSDKWGTKTDVSGSYFINNSNTNNDQFSNSRYFIKDTLDQLYDENDISATKNLNHRINFRLEQKIDSLNSIIFMPSFSFQKNNGDNDVYGIKYPDGGSVVSSNDYVRPSNTSGFNTTNNLLFRHAFRKKGRTLSVNLGVGGNNKEGDTYLTSVSRYYFGPNSGADSIKQITNQNTDGFNYSANLSYTEPIGSTGQLQFTYAPSVSKTKSDQTVYNYDNLAGKYNILDTGLSNKFDNRVESHTGGVSFRKGDRDNMLNVGFNLKYTLMNSNQQYPKDYAVDKIFFNVLPNLMWRKKLSTGKNINIFYRSSANTPSISQLQNVVDNSNPLFLTTGNPDLKQQVNHTFTARYSAVNAAKGTSFFANAFTQLSQDYIANATYISRRDSVLENNVLMQPGSQLSKPINLSGYMSMRLFVTEGLTLKKLKSNLNINGGVVWSKMPGQVNGVSSISDNYTLNTGFVWSSNVSEYVDFTVSYNGAFSTATNTISPELNSKYINNTFGVQCNLLSKKGWFINNDLTGQNYSGLSEGYNQNYWLWSAAIGKKFLKKKTAELKLSVFDIMKQNQSITRTVTESYIEDVRNTVLQRYFMLTFSYKLRNFGTPSKSGSREWGPTPAGGYGMPSGGFGPPPGHNR